VVKQFRYRPICDPRSFRFAENVAARAIWGPGLLDAMPYLGKIYRPLMNNVVHMVLIEQ
jgi:hypothetical protein